MISAAAKQQIDEWLSKFPADRKRSVLIPALHILQDENGGYLTHGLMESLAKYLDIPTIAVYEVATFYSMFDLEPVGRHKINICDSISCHLCGSKQLLAHLKEKYNVGINETTADGRLTVKKVECLGACTDAPVAHIQKKYHERLTPEKLDEILESLP